MYDMVDMYMYGIFMEEHKYGEATDPAEIPGAQIQVIPPAKASRQCNLFYVCLFDGSINTVDITPLGRNDPNS